LYFLGEYIGETAEEIYAILPQDGVTEIEVESCVSVWPVWKASLAFCLFY